MDGDYHTLAYLRLVITFMRLKDRYRNGTHNDLLYWGLDYPPLTAFHEYVMGKIAEYFCPEVVAFETSRGCESDSCIVGYLRLVLFSSFLAYPCW